MKTLLLITLALLTYTVNTQNNQELFRGIVGRRWYYGGSFNSVKQTDGSNMTAENFISWNGTTWEPVGPSPYSYPDGKVKVIQTDICRNVYIGGSFTKVGGKTTGPIARYNAKKGQWEDIGVPADIDWGTNPVINDLGINCRNIPSAIDCPCSVYVVGKFEATLKKTGVVASNVVKWDFTTSSWLNLGGSAEHGMGSGEVNAVYSKEFGVTGAIFLVWFGGSFPGNFQRYSIQTKKWGFTDSAVKQVLNGQVKSIYYKTEAIGTDKIYLAGNFTDATAADGKCQRVCYFDYKTEKFYVVGKTNTPNAVVNYVELTGSVPIIGGAFTNTASKYIAKLNGEAWEKVGSNDATVVTGAIDVVDVCNPLGAAQLDCRGGSTAIAGGKFAKYYDTGSKQWTDFGSGIQGTTYTVQSQFSSASSIYSASCLMMTILFAFFF